MTLPEGWIKLPPKSTDESPEEIRRQRDLYRDLLDLQILKEWLGAKPEDWSSPDGCRSEVRAIIDELHAVRS